MANRFASFFLIKEEENKLPTTKAGEDERKLVDDVVAGDDGDMLHTDVATVRACVCAMRKWSYCGVNFILTQTPNDVSEEKKNVHTHTH